MCCLARIKKERGHDDMIQLAAGIVLGVSVCAVAAMVAGCMYMEHKYPELRDRLRYEAEGGGE